MLPRVVVAALQPLLPLSGSGERQEDVEIPPVAESQGQPIRGRMKQLDGRVVEVKISLSLGVGRLWSFGQLELRLS